MLDSHKNKCTLHNSIMDSKGRILNPNDGLYSQLVKLIKLIVELNYKIGFIYFCGFGFYKKANKQI